MAGLSALTALLLVVVGVVAVRLLADEEYVATPGAPAASSSVQPGAAAAVLSRLQRAVADGDAAAAEERAEQFGVRGETLEEPGP